MMDASTDTATGLTPKRLYRFLAIAEAVTWTLLIIAMIAKYGFGVDNFGWIGVVHGWVYFVYLLVTIDLAVKVRWKPLHTVGTLLAGTIPLLSFVVEHRNTTQIKRDFGI